MLKVAKVIFTRYLYIKDEVKKSLLIDLMLKNEEKSLFWAYELYYSGFKNELLDLLWTIYYDIYYTLNPMLYKYLLQQHKKWLKQDESLDKDMIIENIVTNMIRCPYNLDVLILRNLNANKSNNGYNLDDLLKENDYIKWSNYCKYSECISNSLEQAEYLSRLLTITDNKTSFTIKNGMEQIDSIAVNHIPISTIMLSIVMHIYLIKNEHTIGKKYCKTNTDSNKIKAYQTLTKYDTEPLKYKCDGVDFEAFVPRKILPLACKYSIDENNYLSLFKLDRAKEDNITKIYWEHWEYYASKSPIWLERINKYNGELSKNNQKVVFKNDDDLEKFYEEYGYEPEEQAGEVQVTSIQKIINIRSWKEVCEKLNGKGLVMIDNKNIKLTQIAY